ncbi:MAG: GNAT family N-acetyltransferase [Bacilli bacterium]|nr:GNAT family N-acetyltransferase [Bacilli bacterium]
MIRLATKIDLESIMNIINQVKEEMKKENNPQWHDGYPQKDDFLNDINEQSLYIVEEDNELKALICIKKDNEDEYQQVKNRTLAPSLILHRLAVSPNYRHKGMAKTLISYAEELALQNNIKILKADTEKNNLKMNELFKRLGFQKKGELTWSDNAGIFNYYEKDLGSDTNDL